MVVLTIAVMMRVKIGSSLVRVNKQDAYYTYVGTSLLRFK